MPVYQSKIQLLHMNRFTNASKKNTRPEPASAGIPILKASEPGGMINGIRV